MGGSSTKLASFICTAQTAHSSASHDGTVITGPSYNYIAQSGGLFIVFVNEDCSHLATNFFAVFVKRFPHSLLSMWGNYYFGTVPHLYKDTCCYYCPAQIQFINRCGRKFFFPLQKDVTFGVCGLMWENKSCWQGAFSPLEDFLTQQRKEWREALIQLAMYCRSNYTAELIASVPFW